MLSVSFIAPAIVIPPIVYEAETPVDSWSLLAELEAKEAFGRGSEVWEQANIMVFLASDYSSYLTGEVISSSSQHA